MKQNLQLATTVDAIIPAYNDRGENITQVITQNGATRLVDKRTDHLLEKMLFGLGIDLGSRKQWANQRLALRSLNPLVIDSKTALIPIKTRRPIGAKDGCYSYVRYQSIKSYTDDFLLLHSGIKIKYLSSTRVLEQRFRKADYLNLTYKNELEAAYKLSLETEHVGLPADNTSKSTNPILTK